MVCPMKIKHIFNGIGMLGKLGQFVKKTCYTREFGQSTRCLGEYGDLIGGDRLKNGGIVEILIKS